MGEDGPEANPLDGEGPVRQVTVRDFGVSSTTVSNAQFSAFVDATGYVTVAEEFGWSFVFASFLPSHLRSAEKRVQQVPWWIAVDGANWRHPEGPQSNITSRWNHPVVHVSWRDAEAYAAWVGGRLPTEAEWEYAARGGLVRARYPWGDELTPNGMHMCNIWQGKFPVKNTAEDGYVGTAPVDQFPPNGFGLFNVAGNVWEMCADYWQVDHKDVAEFDPLVRNSGNMRVMRGGSYLCHFTYCDRYRVSARTSNSIDSSSGNQGFRVFFDSP